MSVMPRICLPIVGDAGWLGGISFLENLVKAVRILPAAEQPRVYLFLDDNTLAALELHLHMLPLFDGVVYKGVHGRALSNALEIPVITVTSLEEFYRTIDFFFMGPDDLLESHCSAGCIADFQHLHLPNLFAPDELQRRDANFRYKAEHARLMVLNSRDVEADFRASFPDSRARIRILPFHTLPEEKWLQIDPRSVQEKYRLPDGFLICCNQFWHHKNHGLLFRALALLRQAGCVVPVVCTGNTADYRCPGFFDEILALLDELGIADQVHLLGSIPRGDQIQLIRRSLAVVQPSLFEGWSTIVEEARALGKPLFLSDLQVHKEQAPDFTTYFARSDASGLALALHNMLPLLKPGPNRLRENVARGAAQKLVADYGRTFCDIAREAFQIFSS
jgi:glycosyltransferase involved in cell wall biosynthesis